MVYHVCFGSCFFESTSIKVFRAKIRGFFYSATVNGFYNKTVSPRKLHPVKDPRIGNYRVALPSPQTLQIFQLRFSLRHFLIRCDFMNSAPRCFRGTNARGFTPQRPFDNPPQLVAAD